MFWEGGRATEGFGSCFPSAGLGWVGKLGAERCAIAVAVLDVLTILAGGMKWEGGWKWLRRIKRGGCFHLMSDAESVFMTWKNDWRLPMRW